MHCHACEVLIERKWQALPGVQSVRVNRNRNRADIVTTDPVSLDALQRVLADDGYTVRPWHERSVQPPLPSPALPRRSRHYYEVGGVAIIVLALSALLKRFDLLPSLGVTDGMSYGFVFLIGLVAAVSSCLAVTGGLLLAISARAAETQTTGTARAHWRLHLLFNAGRVAGYTFFGGLVGWLGSFIALSSRVNGWLTIAVSIVMILLGLQLLDIFPSWLATLQPKMPKWLAHRIYNASGSTRPGTPFVLGALTFFLPCGFTQALQFYVLASGNALTGALTMLAFSLGTLPALLSLGAVSSFSRGRARHYLILVAGVVVILLGVANIQSGWALTGNARGKLANTDSTTAVSQDPNVSIVNGRQVVKMKVVGYEYQPATFTIQAGVPVDWQIDGSRAAGCARVITLPAARLVRQLSSGVTTISFTADQAGWLSFSCTMGMTTPGAGFRVVNAIAAPSPQPAAAPSVACDPTVSNCLP